MSDNFHWTKEAEQMLRQAPMLGLSARAVGILLGCSRNAVLGKAHRLNVILSNKPGERYQTAPTKKPELATQRNSDAPDPVVLQDDLDTAETLDGVEIWNLRSIHCRCIMRGGGSGGVDSFDPYSVRYCGETVVEETSWCKTHAKMFMISNTVRGKHKKEHAL